MALGIDPKVDFAFKLVFGSPDRPRVTVHFLNAVLKFAQPITRVEILNPLQGKERTADRLVVLDVLELVDEEFREAAGVLEMISQTPEDRQFYEARLKFLHDEEARLIAAREEGALAGKIQLLQQLLGEAETSLQDLLQRSSDELTGMLADLLSRGASKPATVGRFKTSQGI